MAAALAYYTLFSLFPILLLLLALIGQLLDAGWYLAVDVREYLLKLTDEALPAAGEVVSGAIESIQAARGTSGLIGLLALLWSASAIFDQLHVALDQIWGFNGLPGLRRRVQRRAVSALMVLVLGLVLVAVQVLNSLARLLPNLTDRVPGGALLRSVTTWLLPFVVATVVFGFIYRTVSSVSLSWGDVWPGAVLAGVGWESLKWLFALYAVGFANWQAVYGPVAGVIGLLTWLYLSFTVLLFGAEFAAAYSPRLRARRMTQVLTAEAFDGDGRAAADKAMQPAPSSASARRRRGAGLLPGTAAGVIGVVAALAIGVGLLVGGVRRFGRPATEKQK
jgi:membrane protein